MKRQNRRSKNQKYQPIPQAVLDSKNLFKDIGTLIDSARNYIAQAVNASLVMLYWKIGDRIRREILKEKRAEYGEEIIQTLSGQLGWSHFQEIIYLPESVQRDFYAEMCRADRIISSLA